MDYSINGFGTLPSGEYDVIKINGSAKTEGRIECTSFRVAGACKGQATIRCKSDFSASGAVDLEEVAADSVDVSGSIRLDRCAVEGGKLAVSGSGHIKESLRATCVETSGSLKVGGDVEAEDARLAGRVEAGGMINADVLDARLNMGNVSTVAGIGGSRVHVRPEAVGGFLHRVVAGFVRNDRSRLCLEVSGDIEADEINLEAVKAQNVTGQRVVIGKWCEIERVRYSDTVEISPNAKVGSCEKI